MNKSFIKPISGLMLAIVFALTLTACGGGGGGGGVASSDSGTGSGGTTVPAAPSAMTYASSQLSWTAVSGATYYKIFRDGTEFVNPATSPHTLSDFAAAHGYTLSACNTAGCSSQSASVSVPALTAASLTCTDLSVSGDTIRGFGYVAAFNCNVITAGNVELTQLNNRTDGTVSISEYWITSNNLGKGESVDCWKEYVNNGKKDFTAATMNVALSTGRQIICFRANEYKDKIVNNAVAGLKLVAGSTTAQNANFKADSSSADQPYYVKVQTNLATGANFSAYTQSTANADIFSNSFGSFYLYPRNKSDAYDGSHFPSIKKAVMSTKWYATNRSQLDFTNQGSKYYAMNRNSGISGGGDVILFANDVNAYSGAENTITLGDSSCTQLAKSVSFNGSTITPFASIYNNGAALTGLSVGFDPGIGWDFCGAMYRLYTYDDTEVKQ